MPSISSATEMNNPPSLTRRAEGTKKNMGTTWIFRCISSHISKIQDLLMLTITEKAEPPKYFSYMFAKNPTINDLHASQQTTNMMQITLTLSLHSDMVGKEDTFQGNNLIAMKWWQKLMKHTV